MNTEQTSENSLTHEKYIFLINFWKTLWKPLIVNKFDYHEYSQTFQHFSIEVVLAVAIPSSGEFFIIQKILINHCSFQSGFIQHEYSVGGFIRYEKITSGSTNFFCVLSVLQKSWFWISWFSTQLVLWYLQRMKSLINGFTWNRNTP